MVVVNYDATKGVILIPCTKSVDAIQTATLFHEHVFKCFGLPDKFLSDRGPQFDLQILKELWRLTSTEAAISTAYHPQTNGETEHMNRKIEAYLRIFCSSHPLEWVEYLSNLKFAFNNQEHSVTKQSLFYLMYGSHPRALSLHFPLSKVPTIQEWLAKRVRVHEEVAAALNHAISQMASRLHRNFVPFTKGQQVWLELKNYEDRYPYQKLGLKRQGPYRIKEVLSNLVYRLDLPKSTRIHPVFYASLLTPYQESPQHGPNYLNKPPDLIDDHEEFEVDRIISHRPWYKHMCYLVRWKNRLTSEDLWELEYNLTKAMEYLVKYEEKKGLPFNSQQ